LKKLKREMKHLDECLKNLEKDPSDYGVIDSHNFSIVSPIYARPIQSNINQEKRSFLIQNS
jgi:hypothetical protein